MTSDLQLRVDFAQWEYDEALRAVNSAFNVLSPEQRAKVRLVGDSGINAALRDGNYQRSLHEIDRWRNRQLAEIERVR